MELLEVQLCNQTAPFILVSRLRPAMAAVTRAPQVRGERLGDGGPVRPRATRGLGHPHTNMAKAALNMLTRTSAAEMLEQDGILMTAVDTGWITDERPHPTKLRLAEEGFHAPLDLVDGAARVYDPIVRGEAGEDLARLLPEGLRAQRVVTDLGVVGTRGSTRAAQEREAHGQTIEKCAPPDRIRTCNRPGRNRMRYPLRHGGTVDHR